MANGQPSGDVGLGRIRPDGQERTSRLRGRTFEIASYKSLIAAAESAGETEVARVCQEILQDEEEMAAWLDERVPEVTQLYLKREAVGQS